jgi:hypothetical protein
LEHDRCRYYIKTIKVDINYTQELFDSFIQEGLTLEEINLQINETNEEYDSLVEGKYSICRYPTDELYNKLYEESQGYYQSSTQDVETYNCTGTLYE